LFGIAIGCIGLSRKEFLELTPNEFNAIYEQWNTWETYCHQTSWEQTRFMAHCTILPHVKKGISPTDLIRFDWDSELSVSSPPPATRIDFERIAERFGD